MVKGGPSVNPSGRPPGAAGLARYVASQTEDGKELVDRLLAISRGDTSITREQREATMALIDRLAGRPMQPSEISAVLSASAAPALDGERVLDRLSTNAVRELLAASELEPDGGGS